MAITLLGPASVVAGSITSPYQVALDSVTTLAVGSSVTFVLDSVSDAATEGVDFAALLIGNLSAATDITLGGFFVDPLTGAITVTATNSGAVDFVAGSSLVSFQIQSTAGAIASSSESFFVQLTSAAGVVNGQITTSILNLITSDRTSAQWAAISGDSTTFAGIAGTEVSRIQVDTGDGVNNVSLSDAIAFATLNTEGGSDNVTILVEPARDFPFVQFGHGAYFASILTGDGDDIVNVQSSANIAFVRSSPLAIPSYDTPDYYQSLVDAGAGNDYVYAFLPFQSEFRGGSDVDTIFFYGTFADWSFELVDADGGGLDITISDDAVDYSLWTVGENISSTARQNVVRGFEFIQFNDILLDVREALTLSGPASGAVAEGSVAPYTIALGGNGLVAGQSVAFKLQLSSGTALQSSDFATLAASSLVAGSGVTVQVLSVDAASGLISAVATANGTVSTGQTIATLSVSALQDTLVEGDETFSVTLEGFADPQTISTTINDDDARVVRLSGPATVSEGDSGAYTVSLGSGVGLGAGQSVTFTLESAGGTATE
ncbi:hypothetical protein KQ310_00830, partial [Synechococcus sp. CS-1328]|nr:hypothetical protein [Synechococcus sp. CS-1328]